MSLRVCHLGKYYPPARGGIETHVQSLARAQARLGASVEVIVVNHLPGPSTEERDGAVTVRRVRRFASVGKLDLAPGVARAIRESPADILHLQVPNPLMILALILEPPRVPIVVTYQSDHVRQRVLGPLFRPIEDVFYPRVARILATTPRYALGSRVLREHRDRVSLLPLGVPLGPWVSPGDGVLAAAAALRERHPGPIWLACGRLVYYKGLATAVRALRDVPGVLWLVGEGPDRAILEDEAARAGVSSRVSFLGNVPDLRPLYRAATALWFPSNERSEAFGLVQIEAMASGCPVINTAIPASGVTWVCPGDETGLTVPLDDPGALAAAARRLLAEPGLRERLAEGARERARRELDEDQMAERSLEVYREVLTGPSSIA